MIEVTRNKIALLDQYVARKEREASAAEPALGANQVSVDAERTRGDEFVTRLEALPTGHTSAHDYQRLVFKILSYIFEPELTDGRMEEATYQGTERRDIIYANESERSFLKYVRDTYGSLFLLFELKNVKEAQLDHVNQVAAYLGVRLGMLGFIVTRHAPGKNIILKTYSVYNDTPSVPRKTILFVTDDDLIAMIRARQEGKQPVSRLQQIYREFRMKVQ